MNFGKVADCYVLFNILQFVDDQQQIDSIMLCIVFDKVRNNQICHFEKILVRLGVCQS